ATASHVVFDKTGTLTSTLKHDISYEGKHLTTKQKKQIASLAACSTHPLSRALARQLEWDIQVVPANFAETTGQGIEGIVNDHLIKLGSFYFITGSKLHVGSTTVYLSFDHQLVGRFDFKNYYRQNISQLIGRLKSAYKLSLISGDNENEKNNLRALMGADTT